MPYISRPSYISYCLKYSNSIQQNAEKVYGFRKNILQSRFPNAAAYSASLQNIPAGAPQTPYIHEYADVQNPKPVHAASVPAAYMDWQTGRTPHPPTADALCLPYEPVSDVSALFQAGIQYR